MRYWLMKSEPNEYSIHDLKNDGQGRWDGIRNYQVRNMLRDDMRKGDLSLFYHSSAGKETGMIGLMKIISHSYPDPSQFDQKSSYFDASSKVEQPRWWCVDVQHKKTFPRLVTLAELRQQKYLTSLPLLRKGNRLSVMELTKEQFDYIVELSKKPISVPDR